MSSYNTRISQVQSKITYKNGKIKLHKNTDGTWICYCVDNPSGHILPVLDTLRKHAKLTSFIKPQQNLSSHNHDPSAPTLISSPLVSDNLAIVDDISEYSPVPLREAISSPSSTTSRSPSPASSELPFLGSSSSQITWTEEKIKDLMKIPIIYGDQIEYDPIMDAEGLVHHKELNAVLCTIHHVILKKTVVMQHLQQLHKGVSHHPKSMATVMDKWKLTTELDAIDQEALYSQIQGLPIYVGYQCPLLLAQLLSPPKTHWTLISVPVILITPSQSQSFTKRDIIVQQLGAQVEKTFSTPVGQYTDNSRLTSPWLLRTKWPLIVGSYNVPDLMNLCSQPTADDGLFAKASDIVTMMNSQAVDMIDLLDELILQKINTADSTKGYEFSLLFLIQTYIEIQFQS
ncbi:hypothetical protein BT96DRAFT_1010325 [Gymnopus androsaceus JB14]|uniref:Uncharacterized protein n=1 Tax=Gymnopus androsaceus JB14 TaxID=1447944 RepID=A0A6A4GB79_9AGAR|nr:hypothetical protein BT96DRAFT_1010325 [Gymnopus androsaceus JB14]